MADHSLLEQRTEAWIRARIGKITASRCLDVCKMKQRKKKGAAPEEACERRYYREELLVERLTGQPFPHYVTREMQWGIDQEPFGRAAYEMKHDVMVETTGFIVHPQLPYFGCSPDGLIGDDGLLQVKCPTTSTHLAYLLSGEIPLEHMPQMLGELACTRRTWCDFVSFDPRLPVHLQLFVRRFECEPRMLDLLERSVIRFNAELEELIGRLPKALGPAEVISIAALQPANDRVF